MRRYILPALVMLLLIAARAHAELTIQITQGLEGAMPIAIVPFGWQGKGAPAQDVSSIIVADLTRSGRFAPLPIKQLVAQPHEASAVDFADWRKLAVDNLVVGDVSLLPDGRYQVRFQLLDVFRATQLTGYSIVSQAGSLRQTAHQISDIIYQALTGQRGAFDTYIAYVTVVTAKDGKKTYRLAIADADGYNEQIIYESPQPLLSPAWAPDGKRLAYVSFTRGRPEIYIQNVITKHAERVAAFPGLNNAPAWSPDGQRLAMTLSKDGNADIYILDLQTRKLQRITTSYAIDTEAAWMPDGRSLVFTSDRGGRPQLYQVDIGAAGAIGQVRRLTFDGDYNARAGWQEGRHGARHGRRFSYRGAGSRYRQPAGTDGYATRRIAHLLAQWKHDHVCHGSEQSRCLGSGVRGRSYASNTESTPGRCQGTCLVAVQALNIQGVMP